MDDMDNLQTSVFESSIKAKSLFKERNNEIPNTNQFFNSMFAGCGQ
jgi:hypothetical protein